MKKDRRSIYKYGDETKRVNDLDWSSTNTGAKHKALKKKTYNGPSPSKESVAAAVARWGKRPCKHCGKQLRPEQDGSHTTCMLHAKGEL